MMDITPSNNGPVPLFTPCPPAAGGGELSKDNRPRRVESTTPHLYDTPPPRPKSLIFGGWGDVWCIAQNSLTRKNRQAPGGRVGKGL